METRKIKMTEGRRISGLGLKEAGVEWDAPKLLADQLCRQGMAIAVPEESTMRQPRRATTKGRTRVDGGE